MDAAAYFKVMFVYIFPYLIMGHFVTQSNRLLHFHGFSDSICRTFRYFALIKCGKRSHAAGSRTNVSNARCSFKSEETLRGKTNRTPDFGT